MTLIATEDNQLFSKKHEPWKIPKELHHLKSEVDEKTNYYLDLYFNSNSTRPTIFFVKLI